MFTDENKNLVLQNNPGLNSYNNFITKEDIASFDLETYGTYIQRSCAYNSWYYYNPNTFNAYLYVYKSLYSSIIQDATNERFSGQYHIRSEIDGTSINLNYKDDIDSDRAVKGFKIYDLLPKGMELTSSKENIKNSLNIAINQYCSIYNQDFKELSENEIKEITNVDVTIIENWHNTGRTKFEIQTTFTSPIYIIGNTLYFNYYYNFSIPYDSFLEYGDTWINYVYVDKLEEQEKGIDFKYATITDNGYNDKDAVDINENGDTTDKLYCSYAGNGITSVISTHQDVQTSVKTDKSYYSTGIVESSLDSEYEYKLRVRTGQNDVTNLIIYDSLEEYAQNPYGEFVPTYGDKEHWNGEFLGIDTSYAESKGYTVKTYYSENIQAGNLYDEAHNLNPDYIEFTDTTDKSKVKSLAFEYLDADGNPAIIPTNSLTYVLIKMKSPPDENIASLAYNGCRTQWQALDEFSQPVDFITGINSNIVKVSLPNTKRGSYLVKHEYYYRDYKGDLILENTVSEELVSDILIDTIIKAEEQNHTEENNEKQYYFTEDSGDITIKEDETQEIVLKYIRDEEYGSYQVKHEYYVKDFDNNLTLENTVSEEIVPDIPVDTVIKADEQNHIETNNDKQYTYTEDTGDITIQKDVTQEIIIKYVREEQYTTELPETGSTDNIKNLIYTIFFLLLGVTFFSIATKKTKY